MTSLVEFLEARLAEDEAAARVFVNQLGVAQEWSAEEVGGRVLHHGTRLLVQCETHFDAAHIARHDPARVLREVEAKRRIVKHCVRLIESFNDPEHGHWPDVNRRERSDSWATMETLAAIYSDNPDYREEWGA